ncbi:TPA-induced transmembrane protein [Monodon monoceros]|uniref:TPA-induced transmembrane protein n=1 Tax=Monodon monoceros TaxID=40151 RepID=UPI0010F804FF|nr:TPA-induced transmembrane protein [Monodon monoceros]
MEGAGPPSPGDELELSVIQGQPDEQTPLSGAVQGIFPLEEEPCPVQAAGQDPGLAPHSFRFPASSLDAADPKRRWCALEYSEWSRHNNALHLEPARGPSDPSGSKELEESYPGGVRLLSSERESPEECKSCEPWGSECKQSVSTSPPWDILESDDFMLTLSDSNPQAVLLEDGHFLSMLTYVDEDENEILELSSNKTFLVTLKIPEECVTEEKLPDLLTKRLTDVYSSSPALSRYFTSVEIIDFSGENATITYHLHFGFPSEDHNFMKYVMSEELVLGVLQQDFHDQNVSGCETLGLDPASLWFSE